MDAPLSAAESPVTDALLFCGGEGSRLRAGGIETEKPLVSVGDASMLERVLGALCGSGLDRVGLVVSPNAPATAERARHLAAEREGVVVVETPGDGYVADLNRALEEFSPPVLTVAADLPLLTAGTVEGVRRVAAEAREATAEGAVPSVTVCVPAALKRRLGVSVEGAFVPEGDATVLPARDAGRELAPTGVNVVGPGTAEVMWVSHDARLSMNVNRSAGLDAARALAAERDDGSAGRGDG